MASAETYEFDTPTPERMVGDVMRSRRGTGRQYVQGIAVIVLVSVIALLLPASTGRALLLLYMLVLAVSMILQVRKTYRKAVEGAKLRGTTHYTLDGDGVHFANQGGSGFVPWDAFTGLRKEKRVWLLRSLTSMFVLPVEVLTEGPGQLISEKITTSW
jgi:hypothetical protein